MVNNGKSHNGPPKPPDNPAPPSDPSPGFVIAGRKNRMQSQSPVRRDFPTRKDSVPSVQQRLVSLTGEPQKRDSQTGPKRRESLPALLGGPPRKSSVERPPRKNSLTSPFFSFPSNVTGASNKPSAPFPSSRTTPPPTGPSKPEVPVKKPEIPAKIPEVPAKKPEVPAKAPEVPPKKPEISAKTPEVQPKKPEVPAKIPEVPTKQPEVPAKIPEVPAKKPVKLARKSETPAKKPETPAKKPQTPDKKPETPTKTPETPPTLPEATPKKPDTPAKKPELPADKPKGALKKLHTGPSNLPSQPLEPAPKAPKPYAPKTPRTPTTPKTPTTPHILEVPKVGSPMFPRIDITDKCPGSPRMSSKSKKKHRQRLHRHTSNVFSMFNQEQIQEFKEAFNMIDQNRDGFIDRDDLIEVYTSLGKNPTDDLMELMLREAPGPINFTMFLTLFGEKLNGTDPEDVIRNAFACFDMIGRGELTEEYLREIMTTMGDRWSHDMVDELLYGAPIKSGKLDYIEFTRTLKHGAKEKDEKNEGQQQKVGPMQR